MTGTLRPAARERRGDQGSGDRPSSGESRDRSGRAVAAVLLGLLAAVAAAFALAVAFGSVTIPLGDTGATLLGIGAPDARLDVLIRDVRVPRAATAALVGAGLGAAGLLTQTLFRNPLAEPYVLGVSAGAGLGVALYVTAGTGAAAAFATGGLGAAQGGGSRLGAVGAAARGAPGEQV
ncbi:MAG: iron ABC transporter permease, partial [Pseudonocardia sp.]|nr:iron ABC transporter permease [Pseudonocardia sp.]